MTTISGTSQDELDDQITRAAQAVNDKAAALIDPELTGARRAEALGIVNDLQTLATRAAGAVDRAASHRANLDIHPDGREQRATDEVTRAEEHLKATTTQLEDRVTVLHAGLVGDALPQDAMHARALVTRQDALTILDGAKDKADALRSLAADSDPRIRSLVAGPWGRRYAAANGVDTEMMQTVEHAALTTTAAGTGPEAAAARVALRVKTMPIVEAATVAQMVLGRSLTRR